MPQDLTSGILSCPSSHFETFLMWYGEHWLIGTILIILFIQVIVWPFRLVNRAIRSRNIRHAGWPPPYIDADGDFKKETD